MIIRPQGKLEKMILRIEGYGNSVSLYILLGIILMTVWKLSPLPSPDWSPNAKVFGAIAAFLVGITSLHGIFWWTLTREFLKMPPAAKRFLSSGIRIVRPMHMMTGMLGLGLVILHALSFFNHSFKWDNFTITGSISLVALTILALDGIGLMMSPFLSRAVHRWIAGIFILFVIIHLFMVL